MGVFKNVTRCNLGTFIKMLKKLKKKTMKGNKSLMVLRISADDLTQKQVLFFTVLVFTVVVWTVS